MPHCSQRAPLHDLHHGSGPQPHLPAPLHGPSRVERLLRRHDGGLRQPQGQICPHVSPDVHRLGGVPMIAKALIAAGATVGDFMAVARIENASDFDPKRFSL